MDASRPGADKPRQHMMPDVDTLRIVEHGFAALFEAAPDAIIIVNDEGRIVLANSQTETLFGYSRDELLGQTIECLLPERFRGAHQRHRTNYVENPHTRPMGIGLELYARRRDGTEFPTEISLSPVQTKSGLLVTAIIRDVTHRKEAEAERNRLLELEREARAKAEAAEQRAAFLAEASEILAGSLDYETTLRSVARLMVPYLADWCSIDLRRPDGSVERVASTHRDPAKEHLLRSMVRRFDSELPSTIPLARVLATGKSEIFEEINDDELPELTRPETVDVVRQVGVTSFMVVPLVVRDRRLGAITLVRHESGRRFRAEDLPLVEDLARRAALAVDSALLFQEAREAQELIQRQAVRASTLSEASRVFAEASIDFPTILQTVAKSVSEVLGDGTVIRLLSDDETQLEPVAIYHPNPAAQDLLHQHTAVPFSIDDEFGGQVFSTGEPVLVPVVDPATFQAARRPEYQTFFELFSVHSLLIVPLRVRGRTIGTLSVWRDHPDDPYTDDDRVFLQDLADRAALAVDNAMLYREAQQAILAREEFLSIASHELKTPLTTVKGWVYLLVDELHRPEVNREEIIGFADELQSQVNRFEGLITDLLDASRIQQGRVDLRPDTVILNDLVQRVLNRFEHAPERKPNHQLTLEAPQRIMGIWDPDRLEQVLTNLISNALKYSPEGGDVRLTLQRNDDQVELTISDQGIGITPQDQARLFQPFVRGEMARRSASGTGLGLYITARIVREHGGTIDLTSEPGVGSTFTVRLPTVPPGWTPDDD